MKKILTFFLGIAVCMQLAAQEDTIKYSLQQLTVTSTRGAENILKVPYSVSYIPFETVSSLRGYGMDEALKGIPGVLAQSRAGNQDARIIIRGFGARGAGDRSNSGTSRGIKILIDQFPETEPDGRTSFDFVDMSTASGIEVVRSNSSAVWGNAAGGVINISTNPFYTSPFLNLQQQGGSFGFMKSVFQGGTSIGNGTVNLTLSNTNFDGWREHSSSSRFLASLNVITMVGASSKLGVYLQGTSNIFHIPGPLSLEQFNTDPQQANPRYLLNDERRFNRTGRLGVKLDHDFDPDNSLSASLYVNPKYLQRSERGTFRDFTRYHVGGNIIYRNTYAFDNGITNNITAGADEAYQDGAILFYSLSSTNYRGDELRDNKREGANSFGVFLQDEISFGENLRLLIGARYDNITYFNESFINPTLGLQQKEFTRVTPKAGIIYNFSPVHSVYFNMGGGVEVPAGNETDPSPTNGQDTLYLVNPLLEPIISQTFEAGTKQILFFGSGGFINSLEYDAAAYYINIINDIIPYRGGRFYFTAGKSSRMGLEAALNLTLLNNIELSSAFTFSSNEYDDYKVDSAYYGKPGAVGDFSGNETAGIPAMFVNAGIKYIPSFFRSLFIGLSMNYVSEYFVDDANTTKVPSYNILNATVGLKDLKVTAHTFINAFINFYNITDKNYAASAFINPDVVNGVPVYLEPGLPANIAAGIQVGFR